MVSIKQSKVRSIKTLRRKLEEQGRLKTVPVQNKSIPLSLRKGLLKMGFDVVPEVVQENTSSFQ